MLDLKELLNHFGVKGQLSKKPIEVWSMRPVMNKSKGWTEGPDVAQASYVTGVTPAKGVTEMALLIATSDNVETVGKANAGMAAVKISLRSLSAYHSSKKEVQKSWAKHQLPYLKRDATNSKIQLVCQQKHVKACEAKLKEAEKFLK